MEVFVCFFMLNFVCECLEVEFWFLEVVFFSVCEVYLKVGVIVEW